MDILALLLYPGLIFALLLGLLTDAVWQRRVRVPRLRLEVFWSSADGILAGASIVLAALALALLPWPWHPAGTAAWVGSLILIWVVLEGAFLAPLLPALLSGVPQTVRAAIREAQMAAAGRAVIWLASGVSAWSLVGWAVADLPIRLLAATAAAMALPVALGVGVFGEERSITPGGTDAGLPQAVADAARFARSVRGAVLLCVPVVLMLPPILPALQLLLALGVPAAVLFGLRRLDGVLPRLTLPAALRWCWWRAMPLALAALVYGLLRLI